MVDAQRNCQWSKIAVADARLITKELLLGSLLLYRAPLPQSLGGADSPVSQTFMIDGTAATKISSFRKRYRSPAPQQPLVKRGYSAS